MNARVVTTEEIPIPTVTNTEGNEEFLTAIENLSGALGTPKQFLQKLNTLNEDDWKNDICRGILEKYYEEDIY